MSGNNNEVPVSKPKKSIVERFFMSPAQKKARAALTAEIYALKDDFKKRQELFEILNMAYILNAWQDTLKVALKNNTINHKEYDKLFVKLEKRIKKFNTAIDGIDKIKYLKPFTPFNQLIIRSILADNTIEKNFGMSPQSWVEIINKDPNLGLQEIKSEILADRAGNLTDRLALANEYCSTINFNKSLGIGKVDVDDLIVDGVFASVGTNAAEIIRDKTYSDIFCSSVLNVLLSSTDNRANEALLERALAGSAFYSWLKDNYSNIDFKKLSDSVLLKLIDHKSTVTDMTEMHKTAKMLDKIIESTKNDNVKNQAAICIVDRVYNTVGTQVYDPDPRYERGETMTMTIDEPYKSIFIRALERIIANKDVKQDYIEKLIKRAEEGAGYKPDKPGTKNKI